MDDSFLRHCSSKTQGWLGFTQWFSAFCLWPGAASFSVTEVRFFKTTVNWNKHIAHWTLKIKVILFSWAETLNDKEFSITVTSTTIEVKSGDCFWIEYDFTFPMNEVTFPLHKIWFQGDPQNKKTHIEQNKIVVTHEQSGTRHRVKMKSLPQGEYEFGFKLEWGCDQMYVFPKKVQIIVSGEKKIFWLFNVDWFHIWRIQNCETFDIHFAWQTHCIVEEQTRMSAFSAK